MEDKIDKAIDDFLAHHGVIGMKWGVRRPRNSSSSTGSKPAWATKHPPDHSTGAKKLSRSDRRAARKELKKKLSEDAVIFNALKEKARKEGIHSLSNAEIKVLTARADALEKFNKTFPKQKSKKAKVADFVIQDLLLNTGKSLLKDVAREHGRKKLAAKGLLPKSGGNPTSTP